MRKEVENKYEVLYWDYYVGKEVTVTYTGSFLKALWLVRKYEKKWHCVSVKFRRNRVKKVEDMKIVFGDMRNLTADEKSLFTKGIKKKANCTSMNIFDNECERKD